MASESKKEKGSDWTFLTNHSHVLLSLAKSPNMRTRDIAVEVGITERAVQRIIAELHEEGVIEKKREGRCNTYKILGDRKLRHPVESHCRVKDLVKLIYADSPSLK